MADCTPEELEARSRYHQAITLNASSESDVQSIAEFLAGVEGVAEVEVDGLELVAIPQDPQNGLLAKVIEGGQTEVSDMQQEFLNDFAAEVGKGAGGSDDTS